MDSARAYSYTPLSLDPASPSFRLLDLEPSKFFNAQLKCRLREVPFETAPPYHALSYVWGISRPADMESVYIHTSSESYGRVSITPNCAAALKYIRLENKLRTVWVDAICIDQSSVAEKNDQVSRMTTVYFRASQVIIWLDIGNIGQMEANSILKLFNEIGNLFSKGELRLDLRDEFEGPEDDILKLEENCRSQCSFLAGTRSLLHHGGL